MYRGASVSVIGTASNAKVTDIPVGSRPWASLSADRPRFSPGPQLPEADQCHECRDGHSHDDDAEDDVNEGHGPTRITKPGVSSLRFTRRGLFCVSCTARANGGGFGAAAITGAGCARN